MKCLGTSTGTDVRLSSPTKELTRLSSDDPRSSTSTDRERSARVFTELLGLLEAHRRRAVHSTVKLAQRTAALEILGRPEARRWRTASSLRRPPGRGGCSDAFGGWDEIRGARAEHYGNSSLSEDEFDELLLAAHRARPRTTGPIHDPDGNLLGEIDQAVRRPRRLTVHDPDSAAE